MPISDEVNDIIDSEIQKKTLSLDALKGLSDLKQKTLQLEHEIKSLERKRDDNHSLYSRESEQTQKWKDKFTEANEENKVLREINDKLKMIDLRNELNQKRGDEMKEILMTVFKNPVKKKEVIEGENSTHIVETQE